MTTKIPAIPALDGVQDQATRRVLQSIKDVLEIRDGQRKSQDGLDRFVTLRDFAEAAAGVPGSSLRPNGSGASLGDMIGVLGAIGSNTERPDLSRPPTLTGLSAVATMTSVILTWDSWTNDRRHGLTEIWRANADDIGQAQLVGTAAGDLYIDALGDQQLSAFYWIRAISRWEGAPAGAFNATSGVFAQTVADPQKIFDTIIGDDASLPFVHFPTTTTINGQTVPAGTYIKSLYVPYGVINKLHFDVASGNRLLANDATFGSVLADTIKVVNANIAGEIKSDNFVTGSAGWRLNKNGTIELSNAVVRGTVYANGGEFFGTLKGGGATGIGAGTGLWAGDDAGTYKFRLGAPGSSRMEWNGSTFSIYDGSGAVVLSSGSGVPWSKVSSAPTTLAGINATEGNKLAGIAPGATVGATFGVNIGGQITSTNVSTYIANAAIGNAQIGGDIWSDLWNTSGNTQGWYLQRNGNLYCANAYVRGDVQATSLNAATGTFSGTLTASAINAVNTINIAGDAVTVPRSATSNSAVTFTANSWVTTLTYASFPAANGAVLIMWYSEISNVRLFRDGVLIWEPPGSTVNFYLDTTPGANPTYSIQAFSGPATTIAFRRTLYLQSAKR